MTAPLSSPPAAPTYAAAIYWDKRYEERCQNFDWFFTYGALGKVISTFLGPYKSQPCLHVGCGNSTLQHGMAADGFDCVVNVDISSIVIEQMALQDQHRLPQLRYEVADCRDMSNLPSASFGSILDKGTLDAVLCGQGGTADTHMYLAEVDRLLVPGGTFLLVSLAGPSTRQHLLKGPPGAPWSCQVLLLPKPSMYLASEASLTGRNISCSQAHSADSKDDPVEVDGPYTLQEVVQKVSDPVGTQGSVEGRDYFYCYVCRKPDGASPHEGEAVAIVVANGLASPTTTLTPSTPPLTWAPAAMGPVSAAPQPAAPTISPTQPTPHRAAPEGPLPPATLAQTAATATLPPTAATTTLAGLERLSLSSPSPHTCPSFAVPSGFPSPGDMQLCLSSTNLLTHQQAPHTSATDPDAGTGPASLPSAPHFPRMRLSDPALPPAAAAAAEQVAPDAHPFLAPRVGFWRHSGRDVPPFLASELWRHPGLFARPILPAPPLLMEEDQLQLMLAMPSSCKVRRSCSGRLTGGLTATAVGGGLVQEGGGRGPGPDRPSRAQAHLAACPDLSSLHPPTAAAAAAAAAGKLSSPGLDPRDEAGSRSAAPSVCERSHTVVPPPAGEHIEAWGSATAAPPPAPMAPLASPHQPAPASSTPCLGLAGGRPAPADPFPAAREGSVTSGVVTGRSSPSVAASAEARRRCQVLSSMALRGRRSLDLDGRRLLQPGGLCLT